VPYKVSEAFGLGNIEIVAKELNAFCQFIDVEIMSLIEPWRAPYECIFHIEDKSIANCQALRLNENW
jgi:hypothetical protein